MSMSTHIVGFRSPDDQYKNMAKVWYACVSAKLSIPDEVLAYFGGYKPDDSGVEINLDKIAKEWSDDARSGYEIKLKDLPSDLTSIRFFNSY